MSEPLHIPYEDEALICVNKPHGIVIHHGLPQQEVTLIDLVRQQCPGPIYATHRLDRATSGAIVFARSQAAAASINGAFSSRDVEKQYLALVSSAAFVAGERDEKGEIDEPLSRSARQHRRTKDLLPALTHYEVLAISGDAALLKVSPHTGRQHQIRRHLRSLTLPIWGDKRYGHKRHNRELRIHLSLHRLALHAYQLTLPHPLTTERIELRAPLPPALSKPLETLGFSLEDLGLERMGTEGG